MSIPETDLLQQIVAEYEIGSLTGSRKLTLGYVNTSYIITTEQSGTARKYLLRIYRRGIEEQELAFEHSIINHLVTHGFELTAAVLPSRGGGTYIRKSLERRGSVYCAIFEFLPGEDRYSWIKPECSPGELAESGIALARFHAAAAGLRPAGRRIEPPIVELLPRIEAGIRKRLESRRENVFERCLYDNRALVYGALARLRRSIDLEEFGQTPHLVIHGDFHPGNLKFDDGRVVGLFDLDWSKIDARTFDLGLALTYFCASWEPDQPETYFRLDRAATFLRVYQTTAARLGGIHALDPVEVRYLPLMCAAGNVYVLEWALRDFYSRQVDPFEYLGFLQHHLALMRWYEDEKHQQELKDMIADATCPVGTPHTISGGATPS